jgi:GAF domain-containing protein
VDLLGRALDAAIAATAAVAGDAQLVDRRGHLMLAAHRGMDQEFLDFGATVDGETACSIAFRTRRRVVVADVGTDPIFAGTPTKDVLLAAGFHAIQSTPLLTADGSCVGMVTTMYDWPWHRPTAEELAALDRIAGDSAGWLQWHRADTTLGALQALHDRATRDG